jgi:hypothetical protein
VSSQTYRVIGSFGFARRGELGADQSETDEDNELDGLAGTLVNRVACEPNIMKGDLIPCRPKNGKETDIRKEGFMIRHAVVGSKCCQVCNEKQAMKISTAFSRVRDRSTYSKKSSIGFASCRCAKTRSSSLAPCSGDSSHGTTLCFLLFLPWTLCEVSLAM